MAQRTKITEEIKNKVITLRQAGKPIKQIIKEVNIGQSTVEKILNAADIKIGMTKYKITPEVQSKIIECRKSGMNYRDIANGLEIGERAVIDTCVENGLNLINIDGLYHTILNDDIKAQVIELRKQNLTQRQIADKIGIGKSSVVKIYEALGIVGLPNGKITAKIWEQILQMKESGMIIPDIAKEIGVNRANIQKQFNKRGISIAKFHITPEIEKVVLQLREEGNGTRNIAKILGCARNTVKLWLNDRGIKNEIPPPKPRAIITHKTCNNCLEYKEISFFDIYNRKLTNGDATWSYKSNCRRCCKLRRAVSGAIHAYLKTNGNSIYNLSAMEHLPYTIRDLKIYLESLFEPWMTWENYGAYDKEVWNDNDVSTHKWNIDHIIPHSTFKYTNMECQEFLDCWALSNLRPYSAKLNQWDGATKIRHHK